MSWLHTRFQALFNEIIICDIFISVNAVRKNFYRMNLVQSSMAMTNVCQKSICIYQDCRNNTGISFIEPPPPPPHPRGHDLKGAKTLPSGQSLCTKTLPSGLNRGSKAPLLGHKVRKFHKCIF